jgi:hypothetical protein
MNTPRHPHQTPAAKTPGRPRTSPLTRQEQLRAAKRVQRVRAKAQGIETVELRLDHDLAMMLKTAAQAPTFKHDLANFLMNAVIDTHQYPALRDITWNRRDRWIAAPEVIAIYERNWRFVDTATLQLAESDLIANLAARFGNGVLNV